MSSSGVSKLFLIAVLPLIFLALLACDSETRSPEDIELTWEVWSHIKDSYVDADTVDSQQVVGNMILSMLDAGDVSPYPFLTELAGVRGRAPRNVPRELADVWKAWTLYREQWPKVSPKILANQAIDGMVETLGDTSAAHLSPDAYVQSQERMEGAYEGIGAHVTLEGDKVVLVPMEDSPALRAGLRVGDVILEVDGESVDGKSLQAALEGVRGPSGQKVVLLIERIGEPEQLEITVIRAVIDLVSVERALFPGAIGYIRVSDFRDTTYDKFFDALEELKQVDVLALILDLRSNPGNSIDSAQKVVSQFLTGDLFMYELDKDGTRTNWKVRDEELVPGAREFPMVVIVNEFTGGTAEAVAGALQDAQRAMVLGTRTEGKGSSIVTKKLSNGSALAIPVSRWYTPSGRLIQGTGIKPDIEVAMTLEDSILGMDFQLQDAYRYLNEEGELPVFR